MLPTSLTHFDAHITRLSQSLEHVSAITGLRYFDIRDNLAIGNLLGLQNLTKLEFLDLSGNFFNESLAYLSELTHLKQLDVVNIIYCFISTLCLRDLIFSLVRSTIWLT